MVAELSPDRGDQRRDDVAAGSVVVAPDVTQERGAFDHLAGSLVEVVEHLEFQLCQVDSMAVEDELSLGDIQDRIVFDLQLRGDHPRQPAID